MRTCLHTALVAGSLRSAMAAIKLCHIVSTMSHSARAHCLYLFDKVVGEIGKIIRQRATLDFRRLRLISRRWLAIKCLEKFHDEKVANVVAFRTVILLGKF